MADRQNVSSNGAQVRGDIQAGDTGDKRPGFDPALAPLETDSEAGGVGLEGASAELARTSQRSDVNRGPDPSFSSAMRPPERPIRRHAPRWAWPVAVAVAVAAALVVFIFIGTG